MTITPEVKQQASEIAYEIGTAAANVGNTYEEWECLQRAFKLIEESADDLATSNSLHNQKEYIQEFLTALSIECYHCMIRD